MTDNRLRSIRMSDALWESIAALAERNDRAVAEEVRIACEAWLAMAGGVSVSDTRRTIGGGGTYRQVRRSPKVK